MSSQNNNEASGMFFALALIGAMAFAFIVFIFAIGVFVSFLLSILCLFAWNNTLVLGKIIITPEDAHAFLYRGLAGAFFVPAFAVFCELVFGVYINGDYLPHLIIGGYAAGSLGLQILIEQERQAHEAAHGEIVLPPHIQTREAEPKAMPRPARPPFEYASWDDEEAGK